MREKEILIESGKYKSKKYKVLHSSSVGMSFFERVREQELVGSDFPKFFDDWINELSRLGQCLINLKETIDRFSESLFNKG